MKTHLEDRGNNKKVSLDSDSKLQLSDLISSIEFRISKHYEFIKRDEKVILENIDFHDIVTSAMERINERKAKIGELREFIEYCL